MSQTFYAQATYDGTNWTYDPTGTSATCVGAAGFVDGDVPLLLNADHTVQLAPAFAANSVVTAVSSFDSAQSAPVNCIPGALLPDPVSLDNTLCPEPAPVATFEDIIYVSPAGSGAGDGSSWANSATLTDALVAWTTGKELWLQSGDYSTATTPSAFIATAGTQIYGGFNGTETSRDQRSTDLSVNVTRVYSGTIGAAVGRVFETTVSLVDTTRFDTLTITNGDATISSSNGGLILAQSHLIVKNCNFSNGTANNGGAIALIPAAANDATICQCNFTSIQTAPSGLGGGLLSVSNQTIYIFNSSFSQSTNTSLNGGAFYVIQAPTLLCINCVFFANNNFNTVLIGANTNATITQCTFADNLSTNGLVISGSTGDVRNCIFYNNSNDIGAFSSTVNACYCTKSSNTSYAGTVTVTNQVGTDGQNPNFVGSGDYRLQKTSFCRDAGDNGALSFSDCANTVALPVITPVAVDRNLKPRQWTTTVDLGAYEFESPVWSFFDGLQTPLPNNMCPEPTQPPALSIIYVKVAATGTGDGSSWANAADLATALTTASTSFTTPPLKNQLWLQAGTYSPTVPNGFSVADGTQFYGGFAGTETDFSERDIVANVTTITGSNVRRCATIANNTNSVSTPTVFDGVSFTNAVGSAIVDSQTHPLIVRNCFFTANSATTGGGILVSNVPFATICDCVFDSNNQSAVTNSIAGAAAFTSIASVNIFNTVFKNNTTQSGGGALVISVCSSALLINCEFFNNRSINLRGGAAVFSEVLNATVLQSTLVNNRSNTAGGAFLFLSSATTTKTFNARNCIFYGNTVDTVGTGTDINFTNSSSNITNAFICSFIRSSPLATTSFVTSPATGTINLTLTNDFGDVNPQFTNQAGGILTLQSSSPAIDVGENNALLFRDCANTVAVGVDINVDLQHLERIIDATGTVIPTVDLGAYEYAPTVDKFEVLLEWDGTNPQPCLHEDTMLFVQGKGLTPIKNVYKGDFILCQRSPNDKKQFVQVEFNARIRASKPLFIQFDAGSLGDETPAQTLLIRPGHPLLINGVEQECQKFVNEKTIRWIKDEQATEVFAIATNPFTFFFSQGSDSNEKGKEGVLVKTWEGANFDNYAKNHVDGKKMFYSKQ